MIFSRMVGGLGNQLFQIAACLKYRNKQEKVVISFLGDIHVPKRINCLNYIFEKPNWMIYDNSNDLNILKKNLAKTSAALRFGSYFPFISINDRNFGSREFIFSKRKILFLDGYFNRKWNYSSLKSCFNQLSLKPIELSKEYHQICNDYVLIHLRGGDFLQISDLNICKLDYYKKAIKYSISKGYNSFKLISEDQKYGEEFLKEIKQSFIDLKISMLNKNTIKNDFNLIRSAKLAILSNSTFSWWASFLSVSKKEFIVPQNFSLKEKRLILPNETIMYY